MKKLLSIISLLLIVAVVTSFAEEKNVKAKSKEKPKMSCCAKDGKVMKATDKKAMENCDESMENCDDSKTHKEMKHKSSKVQKMKEAEKTETKESEKKKDSE
ncbi:MAG: hypothetical protein FJ218_05815 [Ignavibacteria bacterium]|nr:hypothetical protein [Ignavibacteria bacterium]